MTFATRDRYRHVVEKIAKYTRYSEGEVAQLAVQLAQAGAEKHGNDNRTAHVGFYLIDDGLHPLERAAQARLPLLTKLHRTACCLPLFSFLGGIALLTVLFTGGLLLQAHAEGVQGWSLALLGIVLALGTSYLSVALVNWLATLLTTPYALPRMDFSDGIPALSRTLVVVPTMLAQ